MRSPTRPTWCAPSPSTAAAAALPTGRVRAAGRHPRRRGPHRRAPRRSRPRRPRVGPRPDRGTRRDQLGARAARGPAGRGGRPVGIDDHRSPGAVRLDARDTPRRAVVVKQFSYRGSRSGSPSLRKDPVMGNPSILVSGASIAGPAAASWLAAAGWDVTVVERFDHLRDEGQNVDVRGTGREVLRRMGLEDAARGHHTSETGHGLRRRRRPRVRLVPRRRRRHRRQRPPPSWRSCAGSSPACSTTTPRARPSTSSATRSRRCTTTATASTWSSPTAPGRRFDAVVIAEGSRSRTRELVFPGRRSTSSGSSWPT